MSFFDNTDSETQPKKRARAGTATPKRPTPTDVLPSLEKDLSDPMSVDFTSTRENISVLIGTTERITAHVPWGIEFVETLTDNIARFIEDGLPVENAVLGRFLLATDDDEQAAHSMAEKGFGNGPRAKEHSFSEGAIPMSIWVRLGHEDKPKLSKGAMDNQWKMVMGRSFVICSTLIAVWPPPLWLGPDVEASAIWMIEVAEISEEAKVIGGIIDALSQIYVGNITRKVR
jgi:hypothetical protein